MRSVEVPEMNFISAIMIISTVPTRLSVPYLPYIMTANPDERNLTGMIIFARSLSNQPKQSGGAGFKGQEE